MPDFRSLNPTNTKLPSIAIDSYDFYHDPIAGGFKSKLRWTATDPRIKVFRVFRAKIGADMLKKNYKVDELTLSRYTQKKSFPLYGKILYDKNSFSKNKSVDLKTDSTAHTQTYQDSSTVNYFQVGSVRSNKSGDYSFVDSNVKFGESYYYQIQGILSDLRTTSLSKPALISGEVFDYPDHPDFTSLKVSSDGILMTIGNTNGGSKIRGYEIYRENSDTKKYEFIFFVEKKQIDDFVCFIDGPEKIGTLIKYKIFSVDLFGNKSINSKRREIFFDTIFEKKRDTEIPKVRIFRDQNYTIVRVYKSETFKFFNIKRKDVWLNESGFSFKTKNGISWQGTIGFSENTDYTDFIDPTSHEGKIYQYKISSLERTGEEGGLFISPAIQIDSSLDYYSFDRTELKEKNELKFENFSFTIKDRKRERGLLSLKWTHSLPESFYFKIVFTSGKKDVIYVDSMLSEVFLQVEKGKEYSFDFFVMTEKDVVAFEKKGNSFKL